VAEDVGSLNVKIVFDNQGFNTALSQTAQQLKLTQTGFQAAAAQLGGFGASTDALKLKADMLTQEIAIQQQRVELLSAAVQASVEAKGADASATANLQIRLNQTNTTLGNMKTALAATNEQLAAQPARFSQLSEGVTGAQAAFGKLQMAFMGLAMAVAGAMGISAFVTKAADAGAQVEELSIKMGVTTDQAAKLQTMFTAAGTSGDKVVSTLDRLDKSLLTAGASGNATTRALDTFQVSLRNADGSLKSMPDQLQALADGYQKATAAGQGQAYASTVLGQRAQELLPLLARYNDLATEAGNIKTIWTPELAAGALSTKEALSEMNTQLSQAVDGLGATLMPVIQKVAAAITNIAGNIVDWMKAHQQLAATIATVVAGLTGFIAVAGSLIAVVTAISALSAPITLVVLAVMAVGAAIGALAIAWNRDWGGIQDKTKAVGGYIAAIFTEMVDNIEENFDKLKQFVYDVINSIMNFVQPAINALGSIAPGLKTAFDSAHDEIAGKLSDLKTTIAETGEKAADAAAVVTEAGDKVKVAFSKWDFSGAKNDIDNFFTSFKTSIKGITPDVDGLGDGLDGLAATTGKAQTAEQQAAATTSLLKQHLQILTAQADLATAANQVYGNKTAELTATEQNLSQQIDVQKQIVQAATDNYDKLVNARLENTSAGLAAQLEMVNEEKTLADLQDKLDTTTQSINDQSQALDQQADSVKALADTYNTDMANALDTYTQKVADAEAKEATDIQNATDAYQKYLTDRANALMDFSKIFDAVTTTTVDPGSLLTNLQGQVTQFEQWQADLQNLSGKGVSTDMINQLQTLGQGSADQVHAMTQMTAQQLTQYVALWQEKQTDANTEATAELTVQQQDMQAKIQTIQDTTATQLTQLQQTWQTETAKIQQDTETKLTDMAKSAQTQGQNFMDNLVAAIQASFPKVQSILQLLQSMLATVGTSTTGGTATTVGATGQPLKHYAGGGAVDKTVRLSSIRMSMC
jgi:hypothetical protein